MRKLFYLSILGATALLICVVPLLAWQASMMTGGGSVMGTNAQGQTIRVTHGFQLHCDMSQGPNSLNINWDGGNHFQLTHLTSVACFHDSFSPAPPGPSNLDDIFNGCGTGTVNGQSCLSTSLTCTTHG